VRRHTRRDVRRRGMAVAPVALGLTLDDVDLLGVDGSAPLRCGFVRGSVQEVPGKRAVHSHAIRRKQ
jgi:hypothetical protein